MLIYLLIQRIITDGLFIIELGSIVNQSRTKKSNGNTIEKINTSALKPGVYFISIIIDGNATTKEFLVN